MTGGDAQSDLNHEINPDPRLDDMMSTQPSPSTSSATKSSGLLIEATRIDVNDGTAPPSDWYNIIVFCG